MSTDDEETAPGRKRRQTSPKGIDYARHVPNVIGEKKVEPTTDEVWPLEKTDPGLRVKLKKYNRTARLTGIGGLVTAVLTAGITAYINKPHAPEAPPALERLVGVVEKHEYQIQHLELSDSAQDKKLIEIDLRSQKILDKVTSIAVKLGVHGHKLPDKE